MNRKEFNETLAQLNQQLEEMNSKLEDAREQRNNLLRERFDLKEQRRYLRNQRREALDAGNTERAERLDARLDELQEKLDAIDDHIEEIEDVIETTNDSVDEVRDAMSDAQDEMETIEEQSEEAGDIEESGNAQFEWGEQVDKAMEGLNQMLQKGLKKVADTLEHVDFENVGRDVSSAVNKAGKIVVNVSAEAARSVENAWNEAKDNRQKPGGVGDYRVSGSAVLDGGCYNKISCTGSCKVSSDLVCREISTSGSFHACGNVDVSGDIRATGAFRCDGNVQSGGMSCSGSTRIDGNLKSGLMNVPGSLKVDGSISAGEMQVSGSLKVGGDCEADSFTASGGLTVGGIVNADVVKIRLSRAQSTVGSIGGSQVTVEQSTTAGFLSNLLKPSFGTLECDSIEGDQVELTGVTAHTVRGSRVIIHSGCVIDCVEYSETCSVDENAKVGQCVKI